MTEYRSRPWRRHLRRAANRAGVALLIAAAVVFTVPALLVRCGVGPR